MAVDEHCLANDVARRGEASLPIVVTEHHYWIGVLRGIVLRGQQTASGRLEPEQLKIIAGDHLGVFVLGLVMPGHSHSGLVGGQYPLKDLILVAQIFVHGIREVVGCVAAKTAGRAGEAAGPFEAHQFFGPVDGQHAQEYLVEKRKDSGVSADAESQRNDHRDRERWRPAQLAECIPDVLKNCIHHLSLKT